MDGFYPSKVSPNLTKRFKSAIYVGYSNQLDSAEGSIGGKQSYFFGQNIGLTFAISISIPSKLKSKKNISVLRLGAAGLRRDCCSSKICRIKIKNGSTEVLIQGFEVLNQLTALNQRRNMSARLEMKSTK